MHRADILRMARESDMDIDDEESGWGEIITAEPADLARFSALVAAAEHKWFVQILSRVVMSDVTHEMLIDVIKRRGEKYAPNSMETSVASSGSDSKKD